MKITFEKFKEVFEGWGKHLEFCFHAKTSGMYAYKPGQFAEVFWESLHGESSDIEDLFERVIAELQVEDFKQAYSSPEALLEPHSFTHYYNRNMNPQEALKLVNKYARQLIIQEGLLEQAFIIYDQALELQRQRRNERRPRKLKPGFVYFIKSDSGAVKIGRTSDLGNRMKTFGVTLPFPVTVEHVFETIDMVNVEKKFHEMFADKRLDGEWFDIGEDILLSIKKGEYDYLVKEIEEEEI